MIFADEQFAIKLEQILEREDELTEDERDIMSDMSFTPPEERTREMRDDIEIIWERLC